jgi:hypothetical protein
MKKETKRERQRQGHEIKRPVEMPWSKDQSRCRGLGIEDGGDCNRHRAACHLVCHCSSFLNRCCAERVERKKIDGPDMVVVATVLGWMRGEGYFASVMSEGAAKGGHQSMERRKERKWKRREEMQRGDGR